jgi:hypothetical protein
VHYGDIARRGRHSLGDTSHVVHSTLGPYLVPGFQHCDPRGKTIIADAVGIFGGALGALPSGGLGDAASLEHHAASAGDGADVARLYFTQAMRALHASASEVLNPNLEASKGQAALAGGGPPMLEIYTGLAKVPVPLGKLDMGIVWLSTAQHTPGQAQSFV